MRRTILGIGMLVFGLAIANTAQAQSCPCDCYFSGDCNSGQFCDWGNLSNEDSCFWRQPKPFGNIGAGCDEDFNDWGQCDGICADSAQTQMFTFEEPDMLLEAIALWGEAFTVTAAEGGGNPNLNLVDQVHNLPWSDPKTVNRTGKVVVELMLLTLGEKAVVFPGFEGFQSEDLTVLDLSDDFCRIQTANAAIATLVAEMRQPGSGSVAFDGMRTDCLDQRMLGRVCGGMADTGECLYGRIQDFADVLARSGRENAGTSGGAVAGELCGECATDADCDDDNPCTSDTCIVANALCEFEDVVPPCDGVGCNDCNENGLDDFCENDNDCNGNDIPDECESDPQCSADDCENATSICNVSGLTGTTTDATNDGFSSCGISGSSPDKWYVYSPSSGGLVTLDLCGSNYDTVLAVHDRCPGAGSQEIACNDDDCGPQSRLQFFVTGGSDYYIRVTGFSNSIGNYVLNLTGPDCEAPLSPPTVNGMGSRYLSITPAPDQREIALQVNSSAYACLNKYVDPNTGGLSDTPTYLSPAAWGTITVSDPLIVPDSAYSVTAVTNGLAASPAANGDTWMWGDANDNSIVNFEDLLLLVQGFQQNWDLVTLESTDIEPCTTNGITNLADINLAAAAFRGEDYPCSLPCE